MSPPIFGELDFAAARDRSAAEGKILIVDATARWCGPCQVMDRTTWIDPSVFAWVREHALAIQIDVDAQKDLARELRIEAMPTIIAFVDGLEFDRVAGARRPKELLAWLDGVVHGEKSLLVYPRRARGQPEKMMPRIDAADALLEAGRHEDALAEYLWLWQHMLEHDQALYGVRLSHFANQLKTLVKAYPAARQAVGELRDRAMPPVSGPIEVDTLQDWTCLNAVLDEQRRTLAWYDGLAPRTRVQLARLLEIEIIPLLVAADRWADAGAAYDDPLATLERRAEQLAFMAKTGRSDLVEYARNQLPKVAAEILRALCAAGRTSDAESVERRARELDPSAQMVAALEAARNSGLTHSA